MGHEDARRQARPHRKLSDESKRDAFDLVLTTGRPIAEVATELAVYDSTLWNWVRRHPDEQAAGSGVSPDERARPKEREAENIKLRMERDLLQRTVALWVDGRLLARTSDALTRGVIDGQPPRCAHARRPAVLRYSNGQRGGAGLDGSERVP